MSQDSGFKHITVTPAEEEDVVIHAGMPADEAVQPVGTAPAGAAPDGADSVDEAPASDDMAETGAADAGSTEAEAPNAEAPGQSAHPSRNSKGSEYRETTLEDLEGGSMPFIQKVVIALCIICIIGAVAYYFAFMR